MTPAILSELAATTLDDIHVVGFVDDDESPCRFHGQFRVMYLDLGGQLLELRCIEDTGRIRMALAREFSKPPDLDDDLQPCVMSIRELVLVDPDGENRMVALRLWGALFDNESVTCSAAQLELENGQVVFADPSYHFGIRLGGPEQKATWFQNWPGAGSKVEWCTSQVGLGPDPDGPDPG
ncbi:hypothetical protein ACFL5O_03105 [Myxococcota bacterium]